MFRRKGVLKNFVKLTRKHLWQSLFFNKVAGLGPTTLLKKRLCHRCFPVNFTTFPRTPFFIEHLEWLLLELLILRNRTLKRTLETNCNKFLASSRCLILRHCKLLWWLVNCHFIIFFLTCCMSVIVANNPVTFAKVGGLTF